MFGTRRERGFSVGAHLTLISVVVLAALVGSGYLVWRSDVSHAADHAAETASFQAGLAADMISEWVTESMGTVASMAAEPDLATVVDAPEDCALSADEHGLGGSLHVIAPNGTVACSSLAQGPPANASYAGVPWLEELETSDGPIAVAPVDDPVTGVPGSLIVGAPIATGGAVVMAIPLIEGAGHLKRIYGGPTDLEFTLLDGTGRVLTDSTITEAGTVHSGTEWTVEQSGTWLGLDGVERIHGSAEVDGLHWRVIAGADADVIRHAAWDRSVEQARGWALALAALIALAVAVHRRIARPLKRMTQSVSAAATEPVPEPVTVSGPTEVRILATEFNTMIRTRARYEEKLTRRALYDPLTALPNRTLLVDRLDQALARARRSGSSVATVFLDIDRFKLVNDSLGHVAGDRLLRIVGRRLAEAVQPGDTVARFGGDAFVVFSELDGPGSLDELCARVARVFDNPFELAGQALTVTASLGVSLTDGRSTSSDDVLREADTAMYGAKQRGRGSHVMFDAELQAAVNNRLGLEADLRRAIEEGQLAVHFQPQFDTNTRQPVGAEALVRWNHPRRGLVPPLDFVPIAEETGLIVPLGMVVLDQACRQAVEWRHIQPSFKVSVNVSAQQLISADFVENVVEVLERHHLDPDGLVLEVTESTAVDIAVTANVLDRLHDHGVGIALDDFGTGYSSLAYLQQLPIDEVKIDRSFVTRAETDRQARALFSAVMALAGALGLEVVAEGVETEGQLDAVAGLGCRRVQGFLLGRPAPADEIVVQKPEMQRVPVAAAR